VYYFFVPFLVDFVIDINIWAVLVAGVAYMAVGAIWYGPLFGRQWRRLMGLTEGSMKKMPLTAGQAMIVGFVSAIIMAFVLAHDVFVWGDFYAGSQPVGMLSFSLGFWIWLGYVATTQAGSWLWDGRPFKLFILNAAHAFVSLQVMAAVLVFWN
jgi:hypothetical protein